MLNLFLIYLGKALSKVAKSLNLGHGSTWPGHIALNINKQFIRQILEKNNLQTIIVAGTNGKTTTSLLLKTILEKNGKRVIHNESGANLLNGIASILLLSADAHGKIAADFAIFEIDENTLSLILKEFSPDYLILLNLFRDQLDRYGEVQTIMNNWHNAFSQIDQTKTKFVINADDPELGYANGIKSVVFFGLNNKTLSKEKFEHAVDSTYCPKCNHKLSYNQIYYSHLGDWRCDSCGLKRPKLDLDSFSFFPLAGIYNRYNTLAAVLTAKQIGLSDKQIEPALKLFKPAFGRQEKITFEGKNVQVFLSKNPTGMNESLRTVQSLGAKYIFFILNDRTPDGKDISWIWDVDFEEFVSDFSKIIVSGDRAYDMGVRIKYSLNNMKNFSLSEANAESKSKPSTNSGKSNFKFQIEPNLIEAMKISIHQLPHNETLYILPTYSAMLETRKILTGKKIL